MCDYDVFICKVIAVLIAIGISYAILDFYIVRWPEICYNQEIEAREYQYRVDMEKEKDLARMKDLFSNININANVDGQMNSRVHFTGHLFETEL